MNLEPMVRRLTILTKDLRKIKLEPNWAQREYLQVVEHQLKTTGRIRIIVLKARQLGISTITEALLFSLCFVYDDYRGLVIAHEVPASQNLLKMTNRYWDTYPFKSAYTTKYAGKNHLEWVETGSSLNVATAGNEAAGRSATLHFVHASELAFWPNPSAVFLSLRQSVPDTPGTGIVLESTANGVGDFFHETWIKAEAGENEYTPLFFPWHRHPEYTASAIGLPYRSLGTLDQEEKELRSMGLSDDRLAWRRWAIVNKCESDVLMFKQEYPSTPEEAFVASGSNVFPLEKLNAVYQQEEGYRGFLTRDGQRVTFHPDPQGPLTVFRAPSADEDWGVYYIGGDPTGTVRGDFAVAQILNRRNLEQVAVWRGRIDPGGFAEELFKIGLYYNQAEIASENEGPGFMTIGKLLGMNYPNLYRKARPDRTPGKVSTDQYGWSTTAQSKHLAIGWLLKMVMDQTITIHDRITYREMKNYVTLDNGGYGNGNGEKHDDTVMSLAIAVTCHMMNPPLAPYGSDMPPEIEGESLPGILPWEQWKDIDDD